MVIALVGFIHPDYLRLSKPLHLRYPPARHRQAIRGFIKYHQVNHSELQESYQVYIPRCCCSTPILNSGIYLPEGIF
jgi:hypothetical protein